MPSFSIRNFGCRVNQAESFRWAESLRKSGLRLEDDPGRSDLVIVNSCTLTARADRDVRKFIRKTTKECPGAILVVTGCYAEKAIRELEEIPRVALVVRNDQKDSLPARALALVGSRMRKGERSGVPSGSPHGLSRPSNERKGGRNLRTGKSLRIAETKGETQAGNFEDGDASYLSRALVKIQDGCDNRCTFCVIPSVRGRSASVPAADILERVRDLVSQGYREIVLAGIHLSSYGAGLSPEGTLGGLLRLVERVEGLGRVRLSSLDPRRMDGEFVRHVAGNPKICQHFHLSLQHASDRILKRMGRAVNLGLYEEILSSLRERSPEASLGADVIVGFPGEEEEDFRILHDFLDRSPLSYFHVFSYSPREGTAAAGMTQVPDHVRKSRSSILRRLSATRNFHFRRAFEGRTLEAVVIRIDHARDRIREQIPHGSPISQTPTGFPIEVLTGNYIKVLAAEKPGARRRLSEREMVRVRISRALSQATEGEVVR